MLKTAETTIKTIEKSVFIAKFKNANTIETSEKNIDIDEYELLKLSISFS